ncbi:hypothetical protein [Halohasta salina]|uniref:hypothetical protein n=1 Tax=Halohasta salina TaxID=2961621 RepID=UPI0020A5037D|nr:hypothetical protein [Halohasta salina]
MNPYERYVFEISYDIRDQHRADHETWLSKTTEQWLMAESLDGFRSERSLMGESPAVRLRFEFATLANWGRFVESDQYQRNLARLDALTDRLETHLWEPAAIPLDPTPSDGTSST